MAFKFYRFFFLSVLLVGTCKSLWGAEFSNTPVHDHPVIPVSVGSTNAGTLAALFSPFIVHGVITHAIACNLDYCTSAEKKAKAAYPIFTSGSVQTIVADFIQGGGSRLINKEVGAKCFLYCNRFDVSGGHHKQFIDQFMSHFGSDDQDEQKDKNAINLLAAVLSMTPDGIPIDRTVLHLYLKSVKERNGEKAVCGDNNDRCNKVLESLKAYHCITLNGNRHAESVGCASSQK